MAFWASPAPLGGIHVSCSRALRLLDGELLFEASASRSIYCSIATSQHSSLAVTQSSSCSWSSLSTISRSGHRLLPLPVVVSLIRRLLRRKHKPTSSTSGPLRETQTTLLRASLQSLIANNCWCAYPSSQRRPPRALPRSYTNNWLYRLQNDRLEPKHERRNRQTP